MTTARYGPAAASTDGKVLVAGGATNVAFGSGASTKYLDLFTPASGTGGSFVSLTGMLSSTRYFPFAAPLPGGKVLIGGGFNEAGADLTSAEIYDPATGTSTALPTGAQTTGPESQLHTGRDGAFAAPLADGRVLIGGGVSGSTVLRSAEIFDPATDDFTTVPQLMESPRYRAAAAPLPDGRVLIAGGTRSETGTPLASVEIYNPTTGLFAEPPGGMGTPRAGLVADALPDGKVLLAGGVSGGGSGAYLRSAEIFDPADSESTPLPPTGTTEMTIARSSAAAAQLPNGDVLIMGGTHDGADALNTAELFESAPEAQAPGPDFGNHTLGSPAASMSVTVTNVGAQPLDIEGFALGGPNSGDFSVASSTCPSVPVAFNGTCSVTVKFDPTATGSRVATLRLSDNEAVPLTVILKGTGVSPSSGGGGSPGGPVVSGLSLKPMRFRAAKTGRTTSKARKSRTGTMIAYRDSQVARATFTVLRAATGRVVKDRCVATRRSNRRARPCTRLVKVGTFTHLDIAGRNHLHFTGRIHGRKLPPGRYELQLQVRANSGKKSGTLIKTFIIIL